MTANQRGFRIGRTNETPLTSRIKLAVRRACRSPQQDGVLLGHVTQSAGSHGWCAYRRDGSLVAWCDTRIAAASRLFEEAAR